MMSSESTEAERSRKWREQGEKKDARKKGERGRYDVDAHGAKN